MQCAKHNVGHIFISCFFVQMSSYMPTDIRNFNSLHTVMYQIGSHLHIINVKHSFRLTFQKNSLKNLDFFRIKFLSHFFYPPYITEEISTQGSIPINDLLYCIQSGIYQFQQFVVREMFLSATLFIISDKISNSDSTTAK